MSEIQPSVIEQLSEIHNRLDKLISYEIDIGGCEDKTDLSFYLDMAKKIFDKIQELSK